MITLATSLTILLFSSCRTHRHTVVRTSTPTRSVTVEALSDEVSYNLDLRAVATVFADSRNLENFEYRLNDYNSGISNLDLNRDGQIDYLRVVEMYENGMHLVVIQAVLGYNIFQDVATVVVEGRNSNNVHVQIVGNPYLYGTNYIIEPVFHHPPVIYRSFWTPGYVVWNSPYYWGYYPTYYHHRAPVVTNVYVNNIHVHVNTNNNYRYSNTVRNQPTVNRMQTSVSRNDYAKSNPNQSFNSRNANNNVRNTREMQTRDNNSSNNRNSNATTNNRNSSTNTAPNTRPNTNTGNTQNSGRQTTNTQPNNSGSTNQGRRNEATQQNSSSNSNQQTNTQQNNNQSNRQNSGSNSTSTGNNSSSGRNNSNATNNSNNSGSGNNSNATTNSNNSGSRNNSNATTNSNNSGSRSNSNATTNSNNSGSRNNSNSTTTNQSNSSSNRSSESNSNTGRR